MSASQWTTDLPSLVTSGMSKEVKQMFRSVDNSRGLLTGKRTAKGHIMIMHKDGGMCTVAGTPSDGRTLKNSLADLRRMFDRNRAGVGASA